MIMIMTSDVMTNVADAYQKKALSLLTIMLDKYIHRCVYFANDIFKCIFVNEHFCILIKISVTFVPKGPIDNPPALV